GWTDSHINRFVVPLFFGTLGATILMNIDLILLRLLFHSDQLAGEYQAVITLARIPVYLVSTISEAIFPYVSYHTVQNGNPYKLLDKALKLSSLLILPICLSFMLIPEIWLAIIFPNYLSIAWLIPILSGGYFALALTFTLVNGFQAINRPGIPALILSVIVIGDIVLVIVLGSLFGMAGVAYGTTISCLIGLLALLIIYRRICVHTADTRLNFQRSFYYAPRMVICVLVFVIATLYLPHSLELGIIANFVVLGINFGGSLVIYCFMLTLTSVIKAQEIEELFASLPFKGP
ncbi:MAG: polysaccharide biosynthesis C-terminal domain-containing protein, partial [Candidatus Hodarchaeota archaeon]